MTDERERLAALEEIVNWTNPGPGGFYDDLGDPANQPHLAKGAGWFQRDPELARTAVTGFGDEQGPALEWRKSTWTYAEGLREYPLAMRYSGLDSAATYRVRVIYAGEPGRIQNPASRE